MNLSEAVQNSFDEVNNRNIWCLTYHGEKLEILFHKAQVWFLHEASIEEEEVVRGLALETSVVWPMAGQHV